MALGAIASSVFIVILIVIVHFDLVIFLFIVKATCCPDIAVPDVYFVYLFLFVVPL